MCASFLFHKVQWLWLVRILHQLYSSSYCCEYGIKLGEIKRCKICNQSLGPSLQFLLLSGEVLIKRGTLRSVV